MKTEYFTFKWNMTLFSCFLPMEIVVHIFPLFVYEGWPSIYKVGISLLKNFLTQKVLLMEDMMEISAYFRDECKKIENYTPTDIHTIIMGSHEINIT
jgi:hypothetical protein